MNSDGLKKIMLSPDLSDSEKQYIFDIQWRHGGDFIKGLYFVIARADKTNLAKLRMGFPNEVDAYLAWTRGDLHERASLIAGGDCDILEGS